jgi:hypothetical protein
MASTLYLPPRLFNFGTLQLFAVQQARIVFSSFLGIL